MPATAPEPIKLQVTAGSKPLPIPVNSISKETTAKPIAAPANAPPNALSAAGTAAAS